MKNRKNIHQGDVYLERVEKIPADAKKIRNEIIAYGEVTGHAHRARGVTVLDAPNGLMYLDVREATQITHEEHPTTTLPAGKYRVRIQEEYFPDGSRQVKD